MADIYAFPLGTPTAARANGKESHAADMPMNKPLDVPDAVWNAVLSVRNMQRVNGVAYREIPIPCALADFGIGVALEGSPYLDEKTYFRNDRGMMGSHCVKADGWIMVLYSCEYRDDWHSHWRCVAFASLPLPHEEEDCLAPSMYWDSMLDHLDGANAQDVSGTVTVTRNTAFGLIRNVPRAGCELRVSWTPLDYADGGFDAGAQVESWAWFLRSMTQSEEDVPVE